MSLCLIFRCQRALFNNALRLSPTWLKTAWRGCLLHRGLWISACAVICSAINPALAGMPTDSVSSQRGAQRDIVIADANQPVAEKVIDVAVLATRGKSAARHRWQPTMTWLESHIANSRFMLHPLTLDEMANAVEQLKVDFVITNPGQAVQLGRQFDLSWLATMTSHTGESQTNSIGSALVVRRDSPYYSVEQLYGKPLSAVASNAFGGYLSLRHHLISQGFDANAFFSRVRFLGFPIDASLYQLRDKHIEAAVVPACLLESMVTDGLLEDNYRVIQSRSPAHFSCQVTSELYPNWSFAKTQRASNELAKQMSQALLAMPAESEAAIAARASGWTSPVSLLAIDKLYQELNMHPLHLPWWQEAFIWLEDNQQWGWLLFVTLVLLNGYHFWLEYCFKRNKKQLEQALHRLKHNGELLEHAQRVAIVGELGTSVAHEINQPLAAIRNYTEAGLLRIAKQRPLEDLVPVLEKIQHQVERVDNIVQRLRTMIKKHAAEKKFIDINQLIIDTMELLDFRLTKLEIPYRLSLQTSLPLCYIDPIGLQQVLVNLVTNAIDACVSAQHTDVTWQPEIVIESHYQDNVLTLTVSDNGIGISAEQAAATQAFVSTKTQGLGLGLAICRDVIEDHAGHMSLSPIAPHGCKVTIVIPVSLPQ